MSRPTPATGDVATAHAALMQSRSRLAARDLPSTTQKQAPLGFDLLVPMLTTFLD